MAQEIERKFLVRRDLWTPAGGGVTYRQGYLSSVKERVVRVRIAGDAAFLTIKGIAQNLSRPEFEYPIPLADAAAMLERLCERPLIEKTRYIETVGAHTWEVDVFHGDNDGLVVAEIELTRANETFERPAWAGREVSDDARYFNSSLSRHPFRSWEASAG